MGCTGRSGVCMDECEVDLAIGGGCRPPVEGAGGKGVTGCASMRLGVLADAAGNAAEKCRLGPGSRGMGPAGCDGVFELPPSPPFIKENRLRFFFSD